MNTPSQQHQQVWNLLPWLANGTADAHQVREAEAHLSHCAECRAELARERQLAAGLRLPAQAAPETELGLQRLMARLDQGGVAAAQPASQRRAPVSRTRGALLALVGIGLVELLALVALVFAAWHLSQPSPAPGEPAYVTLSQATATPQAARLRLVFDPQRPTAELTALLQAEQLQVVAGPSAAGVWSLGGTGLTDADAVAQRLRLVPGVLLAEALAPEVAP